jgi:hypothetical protein
VVVVQTPVGTAVGIEIDLPVLIVEQSDFLGVLETTHAIMVLQNVVESRVFVNEHVDSLVTGELHFLRLLLLQLLLLP